MKNDVTFKEANACECGHGRARHSDKPAGNPNRIGEFGYLCLIPSCACYNFRPEKEEYEAAVSA